MCDRVCVSRVCEIVLDFFASECVRDVGVCLCVIRVSARLCVCVWECLCERVWVVCVQECVMEWLSVSVSGVCVAGVCVSVCLPVCVWVRGGELCVMCVFESERVCMSVRVGGVLGSVLCLV